MKAKTKTKTKTADKPNHLEADVMSILKIDDLEMAREVLTEMHQYIRFSECTAAQFKREAKLAYAVMQQIPKWIFKGANLVRNPAWDKAPEHLRE